MNLLRVPMFQVIMDHQQVERRLCLRKIRKMKILICTIAILSFFAAKGQSKFVTENGMISFTSNAELELIKANSDRVRGLIDVSNNQFAFVLEVQSFKGFNNELQREHFLDKYMEVHTFPRADFTGKIIEQIDFTADGFYEVRAKGVLNIHGQKQTRIIKGNIIIKNGVIKLDSNFTIPLSDHNIEIPSIVNRKIASVIDVNFKATLVKL